MSSTAISPQVLNGAAVLTEHFGDNSWVEKVNLDTLRISSFFDCVLGQVFADEGAAINDDGFGYGLDTLGGGDMSWGSTHGFDYGQVDADTLNAQWKVLLRGLS